MVANGALILGEFYYVGGAHVIVAPGIFQGRVVNRNPRESPPQATNVFVVKPPVV